MMGWSMSEYKPIFNKPIGYAIETRGLLDNTVWRLRITGEGVMNMDWIKVNPTDIALGDRLLFTLFHTPEAAAKYAAENFPPLTQSSLYVVPIHLIIGRGCLKSCIPDYQFYEEDT